MSTHDVLVAKYKPELKRVLMGLKLGLSFKQVRDLIFIGTSESLPGVELRIGVIEGPELVANLTYKSSHPDRQLSRSKRELDEIQDELAKLTRDHGGKIGPWLTSQSDPDSLARQFSFVPRSAFSKS